MPIKSSLAALLAFAAACSSNAPAVDASSLARVAEAPDVSVSPIRYDTMRDDSVAKAGCAPTMYVAGDRCYPTSEAACAAQGCDSCVDLETAPVQVQCWD